LQVARRPIMADREDIATFFTENKKLFREYIAIKTEMYKLKFITYFSKSAGHIIWFVIFLLLVFLGLLTGFWLSDLTGSYTRGFGITALMMLMVIIIVALLRKTLFVRPIIRILIKNLSVDKATGKQNT
jgi:hypothetical protein